MAKGYQAIVLHAHLPFVRHPEYARFFEEDWLYEAITETYLPLIHAFQRLLDDQVPFRISISLSPTLLNMLADPLLMQRYEERLHELMEIAAKEVERTRWQPEYHRVALEYQAQFNEAHRTLVERYDRDLLRAFRELADSGCVEIMACGATHGYMPLMCGNRVAQRVQVEMAVREHERLLGRRPRGFWLPECAYEPGVDELLRQNGIEYFIVDAHGILFAEPRPRFGVFAPIITPGSNVAAFGRDAETSKQVWSSLEGYPGDYVYREFYRDIGWDLDYDYVRPYLHGDGNRSNIGIKYYRITGPSNHKEVYDPDLARQRAAEHAANFAFNRTHQVEHLAGLIDGPPVIVSPYDAELFGHWWFEGPLFLEHLMRRLAEQEVVGSTTLSEHLARLERVQVATPAISSWGQSGYHEVWLNQTNDWIYPHLHAAADRMVQLAERFRYLGGAQDDLPPIRVRALNQAARELLLAQASDWAFIMKTGTMVDYAVKRTEAHISRFNRLHDALLHDELDPDWLTEVESRDNLFPEIDFRVYCPE